MKIDSKEALAIFIQGVVDSAVVAAVLLLMIAVGALGILFVYCWHEIVLRVVHLFHHK